MLFAHEELKRDIRNARKVLWWSFALEMFSVSLAGLSLSYGILEKINGTMFIESAPGKGTAFRIKIPVDYRTLNTEQGEQ